MNFELSEDQSMLQDSVRRWVETEYHFEARQSLLAGHDGWSREHWQAFAEMGWLAVSLPVERGGLGGGVIDAAILAEELGRGLVMESYTANALLPATLLDAVSGEDGEADLASLLEGTAIWATAIGDARDAGALIAEREGAGYRLSGRRTMVAAAPQADHYLVTARSGDGAVSLFRVDSGTGGLGVLPYRLVDGGLAADLVFDGVVVPEECRLAADCRAALGAATDAATVATCAEMLGVMEQALWMTRDHLQTRKQFGVAIGSFQALQHRMADMYMALEQARAITLRALAAMQHDAGDDRADAVSAAKLLVSRSAEQVAAQAVQLHGGMGVTDESPVSHCFRRLLVLRSLHGTAAVHQSRLARRLGRPDERG